MHWTSDKTPEQKKSKQSADIATKIEAYFKEGGKITKIPDGVSGLGDNPLRVPIMQGRKK